VGGEQSLAGQWKRQTKGERFVCENTEVSVREAEKQRKRAVEQSNQSRDMTHGIQGSETRKGDDS
jgi:hypothetical protein